MLRIKMPVDRTSIDRDLRDPLSLLKELGQSVPLAPVQRDGPPGERGGRRQSRAGAPQGDGAVVAAGTAEALCGGVDM